jgi:hypothetical protein
MEAPVWLDMNSGLGRSVRESRTDREKMKHAVDVMLTDSVGE